MGSAEEDKANPLQVRIFDEVWEIVETIYECSKNTKNWVQREIYKKEDKDNNKWEKLDSKPLYRRVFWVGSMSVIMTPTTELGLH